ncbi:CLUMA_CG003169, isoform A [Clunio marinus]|uniref:CLUMA_CG003169, isoform A n=1 Tax=Clunio marinus TaxID=568069 RepID=A0A1J1HPU9_9DIPT|nr:CLUMA_CG003169, isoform A [Clunio marinus]
MPKTNIRKRQTRKRNASKGKMFPLYVRTYNWELTPVECTFRLLSTLQCLHFAFQFFLFALLCHKNGERRSNLKNWSSSRDVGFPKPQKLLKQAQSYS